MNHGCHHKEWKITSAGILSLSDSSSSASPGTMEGSSSSRIDTLEFCLFGFLDIDSDHGMSWNATSERLLDTGCPSHVIQIVQEYLQCPKSKANIPNGGSQPASPDEDRGSVVGPLGVVNEETREGLIPISTDEEMGMIVTRAMHIRIHADRLVHLGGESQDATKSYHEASISFRDYRQNPQIQVTRN